MLRRLKIALDGCREVCYLAASAARSALELLGVLLGVRAMVHRWRLWRGGRRRPRVTRHWVGHVRLDLEYHRRDGFRLVAWAVMEVRGQVKAAFRTWRINVPKKPAAASAGGSEPRQAAPRPKILEKTPTLAGFLLDLQYEDGGGPREPSYLIIKAAGGEWLATLKDPTEARQIRIRVTDLGTVWAALEALLGADSCPWEPDAWAIKASGRKPRKGGA